MLTILSLGKRVLLCLADRTGHWMHGTCFDDFDRHGAASLHLIDLKPLEVFVRLTRATRGKATQMEGEVLGLSVLARNAARSRSSEPPTTDASPLTDTLNAHISCQDE